MKQLLISALMFVGIAQADYISFLEQIQESEIKTHEEMRKSLKKIEVSFGEEYEHPQQSDTDESEREQELVEHVVKRSTLRQRVLGKLQSQIIGSIIRADVADVVIDQKVVTAQTLQGLSEVVKSQGDIAMQLSTHYDRLAGQGMLKRSGELLKRTGDELGRLGQIDASTTEIFIKVVLSSGHFVKAFFDPSKQKLKRIPIEFGYVVGANLAYELVHEGEMAIGKTDIVPIYQSTLTKAADQALQFGFEVPEEYRSEWLKLMAKTAVVNSAIDTTMYFGCKKLREKLPEEQKDLVDGWWFKWAYRKALTYTLSQVVDDIHETGNVFLYGLSWNELDGVSLL